MDNYESVRIPLEQFVLSFISELELVRVLSLSCNDSCVFKGEAGEIIRGKIPDEFKSKNVLGIYTGDSDGVLLITIE